MTPEEINHSVVETLQKALPAIVNPIMEAKIAELNTKSAADIEEVKNEIKKFTLAKKEITAEAKSLITKTAIVDGIKGVAK